MVKPKNILVIRLSAMGDAAMTVPVIRELVKQNPNLKITILTRGFFKPFFRDLKNVTVFSVDVERKHKGLVGLYKLSKELKKLKFDAVADLHNVLRSNILKKLLRVNQFIQIDKGRKEKKQLISGDKFQNLKTTHQRYADVFHKLGYKISLYNPVFPNPVSLSEKLNNLIKRGNKKLIGIAPFAAFKGKMYPLELMSKVISELSKESIVLLFGGGKKEASELAKLETQHLNVISLAGKLSLDEELDVISNLNLMISMDSGNGHIAAMLGIKVLSIWGVTHPFAGFIPFNQSVETCLTADREKFPRVPTSIYGNKCPQGYELAIASILPEEIIKKANSLL